MSSSTGQQSGPDWNNLIDDPGNIAIIRAFLRSHRDRSTPMTAMHQSIYAVKSDEPDSTMDAPLVDVPARTSSARPQSIVPTGSATQNLAGLISQLSLDASKDANHATLSVTSDQANGQNKSNATSMKRQADFPESDSKRANTGGDALDSGPKATPSHAPASVSMSSSNDHPLPVSALHHTLRGSSHAFQLEAQAPQQSTLLVPRGPGLTSSAYAPGNEYMTFLERQQLRQQRLNDDIAKNTANRTTSIPADPTLFAPSLSQVQVTAQVSEHSTGSNDSVAKHANDEAGTGPNFGFKPFNLVSPPRKPQLQPSAGVAAALASYDDTQDTRPLRLLGALPPLESPEMADVDASGVALPSPELSDTETVVDLAPPVSTREDRHAARMKELSESHRAATQRISGRRPTMSGSSMMQVSAASATGTASVSRKNFNSASRENDSPTGYGVHPSLGKPAQRSAVRADIAAQRQASRVGVLTATPASIAAAKKSTHRDDAVAENTDTFLAWPRPSERQRPAAGVRRARLHNIPKTATHRSLLRLVWGGLIEALVVDFRDNHADVLFVNPVECTLYMYSTWDGIQVPGERLIVVELSEEAEPVSSLLRSHLDNGATRVVRAIGVDTKWKLAELERMANSKNRKFERVKDGRTPTGHRVVDFYFANIYDAVAFKGELSRLPDFEQCNLRFAEDPCANAYGIHD